MRCLLRKILPCGEISDWTRKLSLLNVEKIIWRNFSIREMWRQICHVENFSTWERWRKSVKWLKAKTKWMDGIGSLKPPLLRAPFCGANKPHAQTGQAEIYQIRRQRARKLQIIWSAMASRLISFLKVGTTLFGAFSTDCKLGISSEWDREISKFLCWIKIRVSCQRSNWVSYWSLQVRWLRALIVFSYISPGGLWVLLCSVLVMVTFITKAQRTPCGANKGGNKAK